jgi:lactate dehydrogenase-like 2-hydroxyacid dehydrogenase
MQSADILLTRKWPEDVEAMMVTRFGARLNAADRPMSEAALAQAMLDVDVLCPTVSDRITAEMIARPARRVRLLCNYGAGVDHIDLDACRRQGVVVTNTPDVLTEATAELAVLLMLMVARRRGRASVSSAPVTGPAGGRRT